MAPSISTSTTIYMHFILNKRVKKLIVLHHHNENNLGYLLILTQTFERTNIKSLLLFYFIFLVF